MSFEPPIDDELVNAVLDGEADEATVARVQGDPVLAARLAELRAVAEAVAEPVTPLSPEAVDQLVATALDAGPHDELAQRRSRRGWQSPVARWAVAAAVLLVAAGGAVLASLDDSGEQFAQVTGGDDGGPDSERAPADASEELAEEPGEDLDSSASDSEAEAFADSLRPDSEATERNAEAAQPPVFGLGDLGAVDESSRLAAAVRARLTSVRASSPEVVPLPPCLDAIHRQADLPVVLVASGTATVGDAPAVVVVLGYVTPVPTGDEPEADPDAGAVVVAADAGSCEILLQAPLP